jgi:hypothetical protein
VRRCIYIYHAETQVDTHLAQPSSILLSNLMMGIDLTDFDRLSPDLQQAKALVGDPRRHQTIKTKWADDKRGNSAS